MFLKSRDGIRCDFCGAVLKNKFQYYSYKCTRVDVDKDRAATGATQIENDILDFDVCDVCHKKHTDKLIELGKNNDTV